jgi:hypothetical protein
MSCCHFCQRHFPNAQGVKAHLRWCPKYSKPKTGTSSRIRALEPSFSNVKPRDPHLKNAPDVMSSPDPLAGLLDQLTQQFAGPDETARVKQKREALLADLCTRLVDWYHPSEGMITPEMAAAAKVAILKELGTLAIDDMPQSELTLRATVIRNRIFAPYLGQQQEEKDRQLTRDKEELRRSEQDAVRQMRQTTRKAVLIELGVNRALKAASSQGIPHRVFPLLEWEVRGRLETLLTGHETQGQADDTIEAAIERPVWEWTTRIEQLQRSEQERFLDECLALATPIAVASWPWMKDTLIQQVCEQFGIQVAPEPGTPMNDERASDETSSAPANAEQPTRRPVRRRRVHPSASTVNPDEMADPSEPVEPPAPERKRAAS